MTVSGIKIWVTLLLPCLNHFAALLTIGISCPVWFSSMSLGDIIGIDMKKSYFLWYDSVATVYTYE